MAQFEVDFSESLSQLAQFQLRIANMGRALDNLETKAEGSNSASTKLLRDMNSEYNKLEKILVGAGEVSHLLVAQRLVPVLAELAPPVEAKERFRQPQVGTKGLLVFLQFRVFLPELLLQKTKLSEPFLAVLDQETAVVFTPVATSLLLASRYQ